MKLAARVEQKKRRRRVKELIGNLRNKIRVTRMSEASPWLLCPLGYDHVPELGPAGTEAATQRKASEFEEEEEQGAG